MASTSPRSACWPARGASGDEWLTNASPVSGGEGDGYEERPKREAQRQRNSSPRERAVSTLGVSLDVLLLVGVAAPLHVYPRPRQVNLRWLPRRLCENRRRLAVADAIGDRLDVGDDEPITVTDRDALEALQRALNSVVYEVGLAMQLHNAVDTARRVS